jgi:ribosome biogenesis GTPase / thiamine phosphate phosphatase
MGRIKKGLPSEAISMLQTGLVVSTHGRHVVVESSDGSRRIAHPKGKKNEAVVGDQVHWQPTADEGRIESVLPRTNLFYRQDEVRTKSFAANLDQLLILLAAEPEFSERQLARALIAAEAQGIPAVIGLNKQDLTVPFDKAWNRLQPYRDMGYVVIPMQLTHSPTMGIGTLHERLNGKRTLILGPSGSGKSTLINTLIPGAQAQTNVISTALNSGKHTTTTTQLYWLNRENGTSVLDSPGFQEFGLNHIKPKELAQWMPDLRPHLGECRFPNCTHRHEPGCRIIFEAKNSPTVLSIETNRYHIYCEIFDELSSIRHWT